MQSESLPYDAKQSIIVYVANKMNYPGYHEMLSFHIITVISRYDIERRLKYNLIDWVQPVNFDLSRTTIRELTMQTQK